MNNLCLQVVENVSDKLSKYNKSFKYIITCVQRDGPGMHTASLCYKDDNTTDNYRTISWENETMYCIVSAFVQ